MLITETNDLKKALESLKAIDPFVAIDTEFLRENTYWPQLCLVQIAGAQATILIDALSPTLSLEPLFDFMKNDRILKVFHAARQDLEIFYNLMGVVPQAIFDTQIAAMVCGHGEQAGYERLVAAILQKNLDKSQQSSNWMQRPLSDHQLAYARTDVVYLRDVYLRLSEDLAKNQRRSWIEDELEILKSPQTYTPDPDAMWQKLKPKKTQRHYLARLKALAALREREAMKKNIPRGRLICDDLLNEIAFRNPFTLEHLVSLRGFPKSRVPEDFCVQMLGVMEKANALPWDECPFLEKAQHRQKPLSLHRDFLRLFLKTRAEECKVAEKLIATAKDLEDFLLLEEVDPSHILLHGWRYEIFGRDAWKVKEGEKGLIITGESLTLRP